MLTNAPGETALLDWELYRELFPNDDNPIWGRFPHPPLAKLAERLDVSRKSVWRKFSEWRKNGFLAGYLILPHPRLLGVGLSGFCLKVRGPAEKQKLLADLELVDGVIFSSHEVGTRVDVIAVADTEAAQKHRKELISRLGDISFVGPTRKIWLPRCDSLLSARDLRIVTALRSSPEDTLAGLADRVQMSPRTITRRLARLRQSHAVLSHCLEDWTRFPGTVIGFQLELKAGFSSRIVTRQFEQLWPDCVPVPSQIAPPGEYDSRPTFLTLVKSGPMIESMTATALSITGVVKADHFFPVNERGYSGWIDGQMERLALRNMESPQS